MAARRASGVPPSAEAPEIEAILRCEQRSPEVAASADAGGHVVQAEVVDRDAALHLGPRYGCRHGGTWRRPYGVHRRQCSSPRVLVVVDEHPPAWPLRDAILGGHEVGVARRELEGDRACDRPYLLLRR